MVHNTAFNEWYQDHNVFFPYKIMLILFIMSLVYLDGGKHSLNIKSNFKQTGNRCSDTTLKSTVIMMTSSNGNIFRVTGHLCGKFLGHRWIPRTKASDAELWVFCMICTWINGWVNNRETGDLWRHLAHYDVTVMDVVLEKEYACDD